MDHYLFDGIKAFQKDKGLKVDGIMKPDGETENALNKELKEKQEAKQNKSIKTWQPSTFKMASNAILSDDNLINRHIPRLREDEGTKLHAYKDTKGYITAGIGKNVDNYDDFRKLNWLNGSGNKATEEEIQRNY